MEPIILGEKVFKLLGCVYYGNPFHSAKSWDPNNEIGNTWRRFEALGKKYWKFLNKIKAGEAYGYELHIEPVDYDANRKFHVFVGIEVKNHDFFPLEMFYKELPRTKYLFFNTKYKGEESEYVFTKWLPESNFETSFPYIMQSYHPDRWNNNDIEGSLMDWYLPIKEKGGD
ncbi:MAG: AraC family transcriptional regulator [Candidatus Lokiarchaeota archaeon]|nr:AraC family transcriptional regulator [Candidatus Lokiarchaeota archaeon]MBD3337525.1 AraC family transcriptional regulator [Candidatus Lokiarchaeota archaeon]